MVFVLVEMEIKRALIKLSVQDLMKIRTLVLLLLITSGVWAQDSISADSLEKIIISHFENHPPELYRYMGLTQYGESKSSFSKTQISQEIRFSEQIKHSKLLAEPTKIVFALTHNLLIHSPKSGQELLTLLNRPTENTEIINSLFLEVLFSGQFGEELALINLESNNQQWSKNWANFLSKNAIYDSSIPRIEKIFTKTNNIAIKLNLLSSFMYIGSTKSIDFVKQVMDTTKNDLIQTKAIFVYTELTGYHGIKVLESVDPVGEKSMKEKKGSIDWLERETSNENLYGTEVENDHDFVNRFGDIHSPAMDWLSNKGLLNHKEMNTPKALSKEDKDIIINLLIDSKCFGLEAIKGTLFISIDKTDISKLLALRSLIFYSPNRFSKGREKSVGILIRYLKKQ